jgi:hypothetical protein
MTILTASGRIATVAPSAATGNGTPAGEQFGYFFQTFPDRLDELAILSDWRPKLESFASVDSYVVEEVIPGVGYEGRAFLLHRSETAVAADRAAGAEPIDERYGVFIARNDQDHVCECRECQAHGACKHIVVVRQLVQGGHIDDPRQHPNPDPFPSEDQIAADALRPDSIRKVVEAPF